LEKLDRVFISNNWTLGFSNTFIKAPGMTPSDHCPSVVAISTPFREVKFSDLRISGCSTVGFF
jgi:hypothetical protein